MAAFLLQLLFLLGALAAPLLPPPVAVPALVVAAALWLRTLRPPRRERVLVAAALALAVGALAADWIGGVEDRASPEEWAARTRRQYARLWQGLEADAAAAAEAVGRPTEATPRRPLFDRLADLAAGDAGWRGMLRRPWGARGRRALLLLDPDGAAVAWAGEGLLHELDPQAVPRAGRRFEAGFGAATLLAVRPLGPERRPWRVVAGASFPTDALPFRSSRRSHRWSLVGDPSAAAPRTLRLALPGTPVLVVEPAATPEPRPARPSPRRLAWAALGLAMLGLAVMRGVGLALPGGTAPLELRRRPVAPLVLGGALALGAAAGVPPPALGALLAGLALVAWALRGAGPESRAGDAPEDPSGDTGGTWDFRAFLAVRRGAAVRGALALLALFAAVSAYQRLAGPVDLAAVVLARPGPFALRLAWTAATAGLLLLAGRDRRSGRGPAMAPPDGAAWAAAVLLLAGAVLHDLPFLALPLLAAGGALVAAWADRRHLLRHGMALAAFALLATLAAAGTAEAAYRVRVRAFVAEELAGRLAPPSPADAEALARELKGHFAGRDVAGLAPRSPAGLERQDLAFTLWRRSPLARANALSALVVEPFDRTRGSSFSFGLPLEPSGAVDWSPGRWQGRSLPHWEEARIAGEAELTYAGLPWAVARWWLVPRPGFRLADRRRLEEIDVGLLKGGPAAGALEELPQPVLYGFHAADGRALSSPWEESPPLAAELRRPGVAAVDTPSGRALAYVRRARGGWEVVYLPSLSALEGLERAGNAAAGVLVLLGAATLLALLLALPRAAFRDLLGLAVRSYSKRLLLVYTVLVLVPLLLLNAVLVRAIEERLASEQRAAGEAALASAQKVLGERLLALAPGFSVETQLDDRLLASISELVHHEVNLYWGAKVYASSKHELFTAGLLPERIPGEIYSRLALVGYALSSRINQAGGIRYLEIYAPVRVPGAPAAGAPGQERLFLSMPLLAQQEEAALELAHLRRHAALATIALVALLVAVGSRLARNFTRPLQDLVLGTQRIAAGAPSLGLAPTELELAALVHAVDQMAGRIAEARERLVREKQVVERMVENITSGVVSLDRERRVLMHNRVAKELLGVAVGQSLEAVVARSSRLAGVAAFLRSAGGEIARKTLRLPPAAGETNGEGGEREWTLAWVPVPGPGEPSALVVVEDATEELRGQRLLAWAEMARIIAHEIKNPLTPIRLSAEHMREVWERDPGHFDRVFERCTTNILTQVDELRQIASEFSAYSSIPRIAPEPADLVRQMSDLVEGYRAAPPEGVSVEFEAEPAQLPARFDARLLARAVRNLLENALRASAGGGRVVVRVEGHDGTARISVADDGPGVDPELLPRIFDPYFSTHDTGTGLGLPIARRIAEEHGGGIVARNRPGGGLEVAITIPVA